MQKAGIHVATEFIKPFVHLFEARKIIGTQFIKALVYLLVILGDSADKKEKGNNNIPNKHTYLLIKDPLYPGEPGFILKSDASSRVEMSF